MCEIATAISLVASIAATATTTALQVEAQEQQASDQAKQIALNQAAKQRDIQARQLEEKEAQEIRKDQIRLDTQRALAESQVSAVEAGVGGTTALSLARDIRRRGLSGITAVEKNAAITDSQLARQSEAIDAEGARLTSGLDEGPGLGLSLGTGVLSSIASGLQIGGQVKELTKGP